MSFLYNSFSDATSNASEAPALAHVAEVFSFMPRGLVDRATALDQGEALAAGKIASHPALVRFGSRINHEGGADVAGWRRPALAATAATVAPPPTKVTSASALRTGQGRT